MDQVEIGKFIAKMRKERAFTQRQLADILGISDKTVSKWECGNGLPEVSLMLPLCETLQISVNELLSGRRLIDSEYKSKAEENMMDLMREREESKRKIILSAVVVFLTILAGVTLILLSAAPGFATWLRVLIVAIGAVVVCGGIGVAVVLDAAAGTYECPKCGKRFVPTIAAYIAGPHTLTKRKLKCPHCGAVSYCRKRLTH